MPQIVVFGASIVAGYYDKEKGGWVSRLNLHCMNNSEIRVYNRGISGDTSADLKKYFEVDFKAIQPETTIISMGINDSRYEGDSTSPRISLDEFEKNILGFLNFAKENGSKVIFVGLTNIDESRAKPVAWRDVSYDNETISKYNNKLKEIAEENNCLFIDIFDILNEEDLEDGLHPNAKGHEKILQKVKEFLIKNKIIE